MGLNEDQLVLVQQAVSGQQKALRMLAESIQLQLRSYVIRITLSEDITDDIVQETILEMFKIFNQLRQADRFWPWLCKIALNKTREHSRTQTRQKRLLKEHAKEIAGKTTDVGEFATAYQEEFKQSIFEAISSLSDRQKAILSMRCYEKMPYSQIAEIMNASELGCRLLFVRAKKQLQKKLFRLGFGKESLLVGLMLFGKLTAPSEAAAAGISVTSATLSVGGLAAGIALVTGKAVLTIAAGTALAASVWTVAGQNSSGGIDASVSSGTPALISAAQLHSAKLSEGYYFFPQGKQGPVMTRLMVFKNDGKSIQILQNDTGNYFYDLQLQSVALHNHHYWQSDLSVMTLPTDSPELESFLAQVEKRTAKARPVVTDSPNLLFVSSHENDSDRISFGVRNYDALMEERFQYNRPANAAVADNRDALHRQEGCLFSLEGQLHGRVLKGKGYMPFVFGMMTKKPAWLELRSDDGRILLDTPTSAIIFDADRKVIAAYPSGTFMTGLNRPWQGLHVIDTVRRDAARYRMPFETHMESADRASVTVFSTGIQITYVINMPQDWIETITFADSMGQEIGELRFSYGSSRSSDTGSLDRPSVSAKRNAVAAYEKHWLSEMGTGKLY